MPDSLIDALLKQSAASDGGDDEAFLARVEVAIDENNSSLKSRQRLLLIPAIIASLALFAGIRFNESKPSRDSDPGFEIVIEAPKQNSQLKSTLTDPIALKLQRRTEAANEAALRGTRLISDGDLQGAIDQYRASLNLLPKAQNTESIRATYIEQFTNAVVLLAQQRAGEGRYPEAIMHIEEVLDPSVDSDHLGAKRLLERLSDPGYFSPALTPTYLERVRRVKLAVKISQGYAELGDIDRASREYHKALNDDRYISATRSGMENSERHQLNYFDLVYDARRARMLREVAEGWETPEPNTTPSGDTNIEHDVVATGSEPLIKIEQEKASQKEFVDGVKQLEKSNPDPVGPSEILAVVNGKQISQSMVDQFIRLRVKIWLTGTGGSISRADAVTFIRQIEENALDDLIEHKLLLSEFERRGGDIKNHYAEQSMAAFVENHFGGDHAEFEASLERSQITKADFQRFKREEIAVQAIRQDYPSREDFSSFMVRLRKEAGVLLIRR